MRNLLIQLSNQPITEDTLLNRYALDDDNIPGVEYNDIVEDFAYNDHIDIIRKMFKIEEDEHGIYIALDDDFIEDYEKKISKKLKDTIEAVDYNDIETSIIRLQTNLELSDFIYRLDIDGYEGYCRDSNLLSEICGNNIKKLYIGTLFNYSL